MPSPDHRAARWLASWFPAAVIVLVTALTYWRVLDAGFIWDDDSYVTQNQVLRHASGLWHIWFDPVSLPQYYPVVHTSFWLEFQLWDMQPAGYHVVNVLLHAANACLVLRVVRRLGIPGGLLAALVFAVHPVHTESVAWITERKNVLSGLFYLLALDSWLRWTEVRPGSPATPSTRHLVIAFGCFAAALLSKTVTCSLPAVFLLIAWWRHGRLPRRELCATLPFFALGLALASVTASLERSHVRAEGAEFAFSLAERLLIAGRAPWFYLGKLAWPVDLSFNYERWELDPHSIAQWTFACATLAVLGASWALRGRAGRAPLAALLFFGGSLVPALGFVNVFPMRYSFVADHYQYLASLGPIVLCAALGTRAVAGWTGPGKRVAAAAGAAVVLLLAALTLRQSCIYQSMETLWVDTIAKNPRSWLAMANLATVQMERGDLPAAIAQLERALTLYEASESRMALGIARFRSGDAAMARRELERAVALDPRRNDAKAYLGQVLHALGEDQQALAVLQEALAIREDYDRAQAFLGAVLNSCGRSAEALPHLLRAIELNPMAVDAFLTAASASAAIGDDDRAAYFAANALFRAPVDEATQAAVVDVLALVMARWSPERARTVAAEILHEVPASVAIGARLVAQLAAKSPATAEVVRAVFGAR